MTVLQIKKEDLKHNINTVKNIAKRTDPNYTIIAVVKGNGYGLGLIEYTNFLVDNGMDFFAVATVDEAIELRNAGIKEKILMLSGTAIKEDVEKLIKNDIILTIGSMDDAKIANDIAKEYETKVKAHLKIDTGMGRYGFLAGNKEEIYNVIRENNYIEFEGIFSHFSVAYSRDNEYTKQQYAKFIEVLKYLEKNDIRFNYQHICNSSAFLLYEEMRLNCARMGSAFLGRVANASEGFKKIGYIKTNIKEIKILPKGYNVSYLNAYTTRRETKIGLIHAGYMNGINMGERNDLFRPIDRLRELYHAVKNMLRRQKITVIINDKRYEVLGKIGMYHLAIDITDSDVQLNDEVIIPANTFYIDSKVRREYI